MKESKQHVQLPNEMDLSPKDQLVYLCIKRYMNNTTKIAFPSLQRLHEDSGASINTIRSAIKRLSDKEYIETITDGKCHKYKFNDYKSFEPFSYEFLDKKDLTFTEKAYLVASQQHMFKDVKGIGKISYTNQELSKKMHLSEASISRVNSSLERKNYLTILKNASRDIESGCYTDTKVFNLKELGQAIIWILKNHDERITESEKRIEDLEKVYKDKIKSQQKLIETLLKEREQSQTEYTL